MLTGGHHLSSSSSTSAPHAPTGAAVPSTVPAHLPPPHPPTHPLLRCLLQCAVTGNCNPLACSFHFPSLSLLPFLLPIKTLHDIFVSSTSVRSFPSLAL